MRNFSHATFSVFGIVGLMTCIQAQASPSHSWSGAYLGGNIGVAAGRATTESSTSDGFPGSYFTHPDPEQIAGEANGSSSKSSLAAGLFGGYGQQFGNLYLGVEASVSSLSFDESYSSGAVYLSNPDGTFTNKLSVTADWQAMLRTRLGWAQDRWLAYVTGGVAASQIELDASFSDNFLGVGAAGRDANKETKLGWVAGLGGEYALSRDWTIRGEYLYVDYGRVSTSAVISNPAFPTFGNVLKSSVDLSVQTLTIGMSYQF